MGLSKCFDSIRRGKSWLQFEHIKLKLSSILQYQAKEYIIVLLSKKLLMIGQRTKMGTSRKFLSIIYSLSFIYVSLRNNPVGDTIITSNIGIILVLNLMLETPSNGLIVKFRIMFLCLLRTADSFTCNFTFSDTGIQGESSSKILGIILNLKKTHF